MSVSFNCPYCDEEYDGNEFFEDSQGCDDEEVDCEGCGKTFLASMGWISERSCSSSKMPCKEDEHDFVTKEYGEGKYEECRICDKYRWIRP